MTDITAPKTRKKTPAKARVITQLKKATTRLETLKKMLAKYSTTCIQAEDASDNLVSALAEVAKAAASMDGAADDLGGKKKERGGSGSQIEIGATVGIREDKRGQYTDLLDASELEGMVVKAIGKRKIKCLTKDGTIIFPPRGDLALTATTEAA